MRFPFSIILVVAAASQVGATDCGQITRDQGFDLWCGDVLCTWKLERGEIKKVGTWNKNDSGVEMIGTDVAFEQLTPVTSGDTTCIRFEMISNIEETAEVRLNLDVYGDGSVEYSERLPTSHWKPLSYRIPIRMPYGGVRFEITKKGAGKAVVAQLQAETATGECEGFTEVIPAPAPLGGVCATDDQCASGMCRLVNDPSSWFGIASECVGCDPGLGASACIPGESCGVGRAGSRVLHVPVTCVATAGHAIGEQCISGAECGSGVCNSFVCSSCGSSAPCSGGELCELAYEQGPRVCSPNGHLRSFDEPCVSDDDCASNRCRGPERKQCGDGRVCSTPEQCPVLDGLAPGECLSTGIQGGRCE
jgi:hypothetical protein